MIYDGDGNLIVETNGLGEGTTYTYDDENRLIATTTPAATDGTARSTTA